MGIGGPVSGRAVFLDRDGVINRAMVRDGKPYPPRNMAEFEILPGVEEALERLKAAGFRLVVVTNQPDVARGTASAGEVEAFNAAISRATPVDAIMACMHDDADNCACRKPRPGMLLEARDRFDLDLAGSFMVGDRWRDVETGHNAGCRTVFIDYGYTERNPPRPPHHVCGSLAEAADWILSLHA
ncbi:MAG: family hydrolase [Xanthobacteraceae bacterium]|jgi:D-glycero-D-manno-heptose 1,7-bisphosphate phosphatase|nr:family hydrolase [Xanthobacteraceae bacterium]